LLFIYLYLDEGVSRVGGLETLIDARDYAGGRLVSGRVTLARQALAERPDKERYPDPPGWGLGAGLKSLPCKINP